MTYLIGFAIWLAVGIFGGFVLRIVYPGPTTSLALSLFFAISGAFVGGMLGAAFYITHDPSPIRFGALVGAVIGGLGTPAIYHAIARKYI